MSVLLTIRIEKISHEGIICIFTQLGEALFQNVRYTIVYEVISAPNVTARDVILVAPAFRRWGFNTKPNNYKFSIILSFSQPARLGALVPIGCVRLRKRVITREKPSTMLLRRANIRKAGGAAHSA